MTFQIQLNEKPFPYPLIVKFIDGRLWELMNLFEYHRKNGEIIQVLKGFKFDFASIPSLFWSLVGSPTGKYGAAALIHDWLCINATWNRAKTDKIFLEAMRDSDVSYLKRMTLYLAVRIWSYF